MKNEYPKVYLNGGVVKIQWHLMADDLWDFWFEDANGVMQHISILRKRGELK